MGMSIKATPAIVFLVCGTVASSLTAAQSYPEKPIRIIVPLSAGGQADIVARMLAQKLTETFKQLVDVTGLAVTKLDGTAKGGVLVALAERFGLPVRFIGIGEGVDDLRPFEADAFARGLLGID